MDGSRRSPGFASKDKTNCPTSATCLPRNYPSGGLQTSSLTVARQRGILTRFPPRQANEDAQTKEVVKELNEIVGKIYSFAEGKSIVAGNVLNNHEEHKAARRKTSGLTFSCNFAPFVLVNFGHYPGQRT